MNVAIYARVSTEWQAEHGRSIETQLEACREKAKALGAFVVKEYVDDGYSGGFLERPALDQLRDAIQEGLYEAVIIYDADRLARKLIHQLILTEEFEKYHCRALFVIGDVANTPEGQMTLQMKGVFAEYERAKIRERTMRGKRAKLRAGKPISDSHLYGYDFDQEKSCYVINPAEAEVVKKIYTWYVVDQVGGCEYIADLLEAEGIPSATGNPKWCQAVIRDIIHRPHYTGRYYSNTVYTKKVGPKTWKKIPRPREEWIAMTCPQIIPEDWHEKALAIKDKKRTFKRWKPAQNAGLLQGLVFCKKCGHRLRIQIATPHKYYACPNTLQRKGKICDARYINISIGDEMFWNTLTGICKSAKSLTSYIKQQSPGRQKSPKEKKAKLTARIEKIENERKAIMSWFSKSLLSQEDVTEKLSALKQEETKLQNELEVLGNTAQGAKDRLEPADIVQVIKDCPDTIEARRRVIMAVVDRVNIIRPDKKYNLDIEIIFK